MTIHATRATCPRFQRALTALAAHHGLDIEHEERELRLSLGGGALMDLVFGRVSLPGPGSRGQLYCGHYRELNGDMAPDPIIWLADSPDGWVPTAVEQVIPMPPQLTPDVTEMADFADSYAQLLEGRWMSANARLVWTS